LAAGKVLVHIGPYGSGKTELSLNAALMMARQGGKIALIDLDIVNPFFRSGERRELLEAAGIKVIAPLFVNTTVEVPALPAEVLTAFNLTYDCTVFDVGGDPEGAMALGRYHSELEKADKHVRCVINARRPFCATAVEIAQAARDMEARGRVKIDSLVNCTNLSYETTPEVVLEGERIVFEAAEMLGIPVEFTAARRDLAEDIAKESQAAVLPLDIYIKPIWQ
jgi:energy-coupling factor transporter ATP-binding protein EcfA2